MKDLTNCAKGGTPNRETEGTILFNNDNSPNHYRVMAAVDHLLDQGPVRILKNNRPRYVVISETEFDVMMGDLAEARFAVSEADLKAGHIRKGTAAKLMAELRKDA